MAFLLLASSSITPKQQQKPNMTNKKENKPVCELKNMK